MNSKMTADFNPSYVDKIQGHDLSILDVGCSNGVNGRLLLKTGIANRVVGIEYCESMAKEARAHLTEVISGDIEQMNLADLLGEKSST